MENETIITEEKILELYGDYILHHGKKPDNVYLFAKENGFEEKDFYVHFSSFEQIDKKILSSLFLQSVELSSTADGFENASSKEKMLNTYFIFFENLTMNRSLVLKVLGHNKIYFTKVSSELREAHQRFVKTLNFNEWEIISKAKDNIKNISEKAKEQLLWAHLVSAVEFWKKDTSPSFEKTDLYLEKTIDTGFDLIDNEPLRKVMDLGKFLFKETFKKN
ncbi:TetR/AcrR family transcriptional regulator [Rhizosphaericola mali]|uniref:TetR/AcrR family transcriptional regulator n=1 Tax=Rhizosphaericola mali TaxID=2545455 RepID=A0A5P2G473_9BACT|nr:TetR/AcrR family transcriptional regulator [Rhizosphaericola mali]QES88560.1 TetR/AcrR family transcriptional regulator [Rhizosphaericola mali]